MARTTKKAARVRVKPVPGPGALDRLFTPGNILFCATLWVVAGFCVLLLVDSRERLLTAAVTFAVLGWLVTVAVALQNRIRQHTFELILTTRFNPVYRENAKTVQDYTLKLGVITENMAREISQRKTYKDAKLDKALGLLANFYELLAIAVKHKDADEKILREFFEDILINFFDKIEPLLPFWRGEKEPLESRGDYPSGSVPFLPPRPYPQAFIYLEELCRNWKLARQYGEA